MSDAASIEGTCDPRFGAVGAAFEENFRSRGEIGAAVCLYKNGRKVVDLWGGVADPATGAAWKQDTIVCMMSVGKAMAALCVHRLIDRGEIDLDAPVVRYWPRFGQAGKERITVRQLLGGQTALIYADAAPPGSLLDWELMIDALERQAPEWEPGTRGAYHSMSAGFLFGELVRQVDGRGPGVFFRDEIAIPLGADYQIGLDDAQIARVAPLLPNPGSVTGNAMRDPSTKLGRAWRARPDDPDFFNSDACRRGVLPSGNGHGNARGVARIFACLANDGELDGVRLFRPATVERMRQLQWEGICGMTDRHFRYALGLFVNSHPVMPMGPNAHAFGHAGAGGALGFADPENGIAFSYSPNFMCAGAGVGDRCPALIDAVYA
jgi:CubicO group peptidase (beta-lactamase class C family)